ncbi:hypothetical protein CQW39_30485 [Streptomyces griseofuscus]|nr:hypothetical protein CQW39_30485 [Streptomyces griseofuscus]
MSGFPMYDGELPIVATGMKQPTMQRRASTISRRECASGPPLGVRQARTGSSGSMNAHSSPQPHTRKARHQGAWSTLKLSAKPSGIPLRLHFLEGPMRTRPSSEA